MQVLGAASHTNCKQDDVMLGGYEQTAYWALLTAELVHVRAAARRDHLADELRRHHRIPYYNVYSPQ